MMQLGTPALFVRQYGLLIILVALLPGLGIAPQSFFTAHVNCSVRQHEAKPNDGKVGPDHHPRRPRLDRDLLQHPSGFLPPELRKVRPSCLINCRARSRFGNYQGHEVTPVSYDWPDETLEPFRSNKRQHQPAFVAVQKVDQDGPYHPGRNLSRLMLLKRCWQDVTTTAVNRLLGRINRNDFGGSTV